MSFPAIRLEKYLISVVMSYVHIPVCMVPLPYYTTSWPYIQACLQIALCARGTHLTSGMGVIPCGNRTSLVRLSVEVRPFSLCMWVARLADLRLIFPAPLFGREWLMTRISTEAQGRVAEPPALPNHI